MKAHGHEVVLNRLVLGKQRFERIGFGQLAVGPAVEQVARLVALSHGGAEEAERGRLADDQAELAAGHIDARPFFHAERHDAQRPQRPRRAGNRQAGRFDADVVRPGRAAANPHAAALLGPAVVRRAAGDGMIEVVLAFEHLRRAIRPTSS